MKTNINHFIKAIIFSTLLLVIVCFLNAGQFVQAQNTTTVSKVTLSRNLSIGMSGSDVSSLQQFLKDNGYFTNSKITGYFGKVTKKAVIKFQSDNKIKPTGAVGPKTKTRIFEISSILPTVIQNPVNITQKVIPIRNGWGTHNTADTILPAVSLTAPTDGSTVSGSSVTISASATDNVSVAGVQFKIDNVNVGSEDTSSPYSITWDSTAFPSGSKVITAVARDTANNLKTSTPVTVTIDNTAPVISAISASAPTSTSITVIWTTDEPANSQVDYGVTSSYGSTTVLNPTLTTSHSITITGLIAGTNYHYRVRSADTYSNSSLSGDQTITPLANLVLEYRLDEGSGRFVSNGIYPTTTTSNLLPTMPEQLFPGNLSNTAYTITNNFAANPNGDLIATRLLGPASASNRLYTTPTYSISTPYTLSVYAKSNTGGTQKMRLELDSSVSSDFTLTTSWQRISYTVTTGGTHNRVGIMGASDASTQDILIWGLQFEAGSTPTAYVTQYLHQILGGSYVSSSSDPSWQSWGLRFDGTQQLTKGVTWQPINLSQTSVYMAIRKVGAYTTLIAPALSPFSPSDTPTSTLHIWPKGYPSPYFEFGFGGTTLNYYLGALDDGLWHITAATYDGSKLNIYVDGNLVAQKSASSLSPVTLYNLALGGHNSAWYFPGDIGWVDIYSVGHNASQVAANTTAIRNSMLAKGVTIPSQPSDTFINFEGDSITDPSAAPSGAENGYAYLVSHAISPSRYMQAASYAIAGSNMTDLNNRASDVDAAFAATTATKKVLTVLIGSNDIATQGRSAATLVSLLKTYCLARKAATPGLKIVVMTVLPRSAVFSGVNEATFNSIRHSANALILGDSSYYDAVADIGNIGTTMGADSAADSTTYYGDGVHPTVLGQSLIETAIETAVRSVL